MKAEILFAGGPWHGEMRKMRLAPLIIPAGADHRTQAYEMVAWDDQTTTHFYRWTENAEWPRRQVYQG